MATWVLLNPGLNSLLHWHQSCRGCWGSQKKASGLNQTGFLQQLHCVPIHCQPTKSNQAEHFNTKSFVSVLVFVLFVLFFNALNICLSFLFGFWFSVWLTRKHLTKVTFGYSYMPISAVPGCLGRKKDAWKLCSAEYWWNMDGIPKERTKHRTLIYISIWYIYI